MPRRLEDRLEAVRKALRDRSSATSRKVLLAALGKNEAIVIATIADALDESDTAMLERLPEVFTRMLDDPAKRDPGCRAKTSIVKALYRCDVRAEATFVAGVGHVQREPVFGGSVDTAAELRGTSAMALVVARHPRVFVELALLLADPERVARVAAARAIAASGDREIGEPLLRLRLAIGELDPEVLTEIDTALLELCDDDAIPLVAAKLHAPDASVAEAAALALGGSRRPAALPHLVRCLEAPAVFGARGRVLALAIALLRTDEAWSYLLQRIEAGERGEAEDAIAALATFSYDAELSDRVSASVQARGDSALRPLVDDLFPSRTEE